MGTVAVPPKPVEPSAALVVGRREQLAALTTDVGEQDFEIAGLVPGRGERLQAELDTGFDGFRNDEFGTQPLKPMDLIVIARAGGDRQVRPQQARGLDGALDCDRIVQNHDDHTGTAGACRIQRAVLRAVAEEDRKAASKWAGARPGHSDRPAQDTSRIACQTRAGVSGMSSVMTPIGASASSAALTIAAGAPMQPLSPTPLTPSALPGAGVSCEVVS